MHKECNGRFGFKVASEILRHDQHTAIPGGRIREIRFFGLRTLPIAIATNVHGAVTKQSLRSVDIPAAVLSTLSQLASGRPLAEKRTIHGSHVLGTAGRPSSYSKIICHRWSGRTSCGGDQLRRDSTGYRQSFSTYSYPCSNHCLVPS